MNHQIDSDHLLILDTVKIEGEWGWGGVAVSPSQNKIRRVNLKEERTFSVRAATVFVSGRPLMS